MGNITNAAANADYTSCADGGDVSGDMCTPVCAAGYTAYVEAAGFTLVCDSNNGGFSGHDETLQCVPNVCNGGSITNAIAGADYSSCTDGDGTSGICTPVCAAGYTASVGAAGFVLMCDSSGDFDGSDETLDCAPNVCNGDSIIGAIAGADYSTCIDGDTTSDTCTPVCALGYTTNVGAAGFALVCDAGTGSFNGADGTLDCDPNPCSSGSITNAIAGADYSSCTDGDDFSGDTCTPVCAAGYTTVVEAAGFVLECGAGDGGFDGADVALECAVTGRLIAAGNNHATFLLADGKAMGMGSNRKGQLGDGSTTGLNANPNAISVLGITDAIAIAAGSYHTVFLLANGRAMGVGLNTFGQLGDGSTTDQTTVTAAVGITDAIAIAAGNGHTVFLLTGGTAMAVGWNGYGQLGDGSTTDQHNAITVQGITGTIIAIAAGDYHTVFLLTDGTAMVVGSNSNGQLGNGGTSRFHQHTAIFVVGITDAIAIAAGAYHTIFLTADATVMAVGRNHYGQLGDGGTADRYIAVAVPFITDAVAIAAASDGHSVFLLANGTAMAVGRNSEGQLGDESTTERHTAIVAHGITDAIAIAAGGYHTMFLLADGTLMGVGLNEYGQLGDGTTTPHTSAVAVLGVNLRGVLCTSNIIANPVSGADYSSCTDGDDVSGDTCLPVCAAGYTTVSEAAGFVLECGAGDGGFDGADAALECAFETSLSLPHTFIGHSGPVSSLFISDNYLFSGSWDHTAKMWDVSQGNVLSTYTGHTGDVNSVVVSGDYLFTGSEDGTAKMWEISTSGDVGNSARTFDGHGSAAVRSIFVSGNHLFTGSNFQGSTGGTVKMWDISAGTVLETFTETGWRAVNSLFVSGNHLFVAAVGSQLTDVQMFDTSTGQVVATFTDHDSDTYVLSVFVSGDYLYTGSVEGTANMYNISTGDVVWTFTGHTSNVEVVFVSDNRLYTGSTDSTVKMWDTSTGSLVTSFSSYDEHASGCPPVCAVRAVFVSGNYLFTGPTSSEGIINMMDILA